MSLATQVGAFAANSKPQALVKDAVRDEDTADTTEGSCISDNEVSSCADSQSDKQSEVKALLEPSVCSRRAALRGAGNNVLEKMNAEQPRPQQKRSARKEAKDASKQQPAKKAPVPHLPPGLEDYWTSANSQEGFSKSGTRIQESSSSALEPAKVRGTPEDVIINKLESMMPMKKMPLYGFGPSGAFDPTEPLKKRVSTFLTQEPPFVLTCH
mmetsp:Transcript_87683/g.151952  ORF Transcript_87683/g.151952 Transcript_87683/m.151952 type:complete len:212 (-) Transcript_87683:170-805(-)